MGTAYKIRCKHCGAQFEHSTQPGFGLMPMCVGCGEYVETETAIRCPACRRRLNTTQEEFNEQVEVHLPLGLRPQKSRPGSAEITGNFHIFEK